MHWRTTRNRGPTLIIMLRGRLWALLVRFITFTNFTLLPPYPHVQLEPTGTSLQHHVGRQKQVIVIQSEVAFCEEIDAFNHTKEAEYIPTRYEDTQHDVVLLSSSVTFRGISTGTPSKETCF